jgi:hypothetical protein
MESRHRSGTRSGILANENASGLARRIPSTPHHRNPRPVANERRERTAKPIVRHDNRVAVFVGACLIVGVCDRERGPPAGQPRGLAGTLVRCGRRCGSGASRANERRCERRDRDRRSLRPLRKSGFSDDELCDQRRSPLRAMLRQAARRGTKAPLGYRCAGPGGAGVRRHRRVRIASSPLARRSGPGAHADNVAAVATGAGSLVQPRRGSQRRSRRERAALVDLRQKQFQRFAIQLLHDAAVGSEDRRGEIALRFLERRDLFLDGVAAK